MPSRPRAKDMSPLTGHSNVLIDVRMPRAQRELMNVLAPHLTRERVDRLFKHFPTSKASVQPYDLTFRRLNWLLTHYSVQHKTPITLPDGRTVLLHELHAQQLFQRQGKKFFDVFNRTAAVSLRCASPAIETSPAQLSLLLWADEMGVLALAKRLARPLYEDSRLYRMRKVTGRKRLLDRCSPEPLEPIVRNKRMRLMI